MVARKHKAPDTIPDDNERDTKRVRSSDIEADADDASPRTTPRKSTSSAQTPRAVRAPGHPITDADVTLRPADRDRLVSILNITEPDANRYNIGLIPTSATWGPVGDGTGFDKYLCYEDRPVVAWMLGVATSTWLIPPEGSRVSVGVRPLCQRDLEAVRFFQYLAARPAGDPSAAGLATYAGRFLNTRGDNPQTEFQDVYDGCDRLASWSAMASINAARIQKTDVVLVECYIKRFKPREGGNRYSWASWGVSFELLKIAHILAGPGPTELVPDDSNVNL